MARGALVLPGRIVLDELNQEKAIDQEEYRHALKEYQLRMLTLQRALAETRNTLIVVVEGPDAAGKGGPIKRLVEKLDPRTFRVYSIVKPTQEENSNTIFGGFGTSCRPPGKSRSLIVLGTAESLSNALKSSRRCRNGDGLTGKSTNLSGF